MIKNFLQRLIKNLSPDVFRPVPNGLLYTVLQAIEREIGGECPWDTGEECLKGYTAYWSPQCRNMECKGYRHPAGLIAYTSRSSEASSVDNRFDYSSFRYLSGNGDDWIEVGTLGAKIQFDFGLREDDGGYGAGLYGFSYYGYNAVIPGGKDIVIGDKWYVICHTASTVVGSDGKNYQCKVAHVSNPARRPVTGANWADYWKEGGMSGDSWQNGVSYDVTSVVKSPYADPANKGIYGAVGAKGPYRGDHDTIYTVELIDFRGYNQDFQDAILQISLATCTGEWLDYWGDYFGIPRLVLRTEEGVFKGYEDDETYRARIMKEITRAKGTRAVLYEEAVNFFKSDRVTVEEYFQFNAQNVVVGTDGQFYKCIQRHTSTTARRPITGANWQSFWIQGGTGANTWIEGLWYEDGTQFPKWDGPVQQVGSPSRGLWPFQFYINIPSQKSPSAKFVKNADVPLCRCESGYGAVSCVCDATNYGTSGCACDASCYGDTPCTCDAACYGYQHVCECDVTCYGFSPCGCDATCYAQSCGCNATCYYLGSSWCYCFWTCYAQGCSCNATCYGHSSCACNAVCYVEGHSCACNNVCYAFHSCNCNMTCYAETCTCNNSCYGQGCSCNAQCYSQGGGCKGDYSPPCICDYSCYGYTPCSCNAVCYTHACSCESACYGYTPCACDATCYGEQTGACTCNSMCYGYTGCTCDSVCYGYISCLCDATNYGEAPCACDGSCYGYTPPQTFRPDGEGYTYEAGYGYFYGYGAFVPIVPGTKVFSEPINVGDAILIGHEYQFSGVYFKWITPGVGGDYVWEYWNGAEWATLTFRDANLSPAPGEENVDDLTQDGWCHWLEGLTGWLKADNIPYNIPNTGTELYWVRCRVLTPPSVTPVVELYYITYAGQTCRGHYIAHGIDVCACYATCYGDRPCTCDGTSYQYSSCTCDFACYADTPCSCNFTNYGYSSCSCDVACYGYTACACNLSCYAQSCGCNATCYYLGSSWCYCFWTCYSQGCSCNGTCYGYTGCSCDISCYQFAPCSCDGACYSYHGCDCDAVCYGYHMCTCEATCYGDYACSCNAVCYSQQPANYNPALRDRNNCYIYFEGSFSKPNYQSGLQEILDRLKTAGTIVIINPLD